MITISKKLILYFFLLLSFSLRGQDISFTFEEWKDPSIFDVNQTKMHTPLVPYNTEKEARVGNRNENPNYLSLNGLWKFKWVITPDLRPMDFYKTSFSCQQWEDIIVPGNWQMQGFGHPKFRNVALTFPSDPPHVPAYYNPVGSYRRTFTIPENWTKKQMFLHFEGLKSASYIWINGNALGYNQGGMEAVEFDVSDFVEKGENVIAVQILRYSDGTYLENQDMWRLSGIYRDVYLFATPEVHIRDYYVHTDFDQAYENALLNVEVEVDKYAASSQNHSIAINLYDDKGKKVFKKELIKTPDRLDVGKTNEISFSVEVKKPLKWSAESPNLYELTLELLDDRNKTIESYSDQIGFRETEIINGAIHVNGVPVKFNGVNSHMHHPIYGKTIPRETIIKDFELMKQFNINLVRTSHYPPAPEYLDLADEYGVYVVDEAGTECHENIYLSDDPLWEEAFVDRGKKMVLHDRNHPSIVFWSAGNEAGSGPNIKAVIEEGKRLDPSRPDWMYGGNTYMIPFEDIVGPRYWKPYALKQLAEQDPAIDARPSFMDEYLAATGNSLGGMDEYWDLIYRYPRLSGGAIWDWISPGIEMPVRIVQDFSKTKALCAIMGGAELVEGKEGKGLYLSGHDEWMEIYRHPELDVSGKSLTIEFMVKPDQFYHVNPFITKGDHQLGIVQRDKHSIEFHVYGKDRVRVVSGLPEDWEGNWHHVVGMYNGRRLYLYIDGNIAASLPYSGSISKGYYPINIGRNAELHDPEHPGMLAHGTIDQVRIYADPYTAKELEVLKESEKRDKSVLYLDFEKEEHKGEFFWTGLEGRTYGLIWPDRTVQPELYQVKKSAQPVKVTAQNIENGRFSIKNRHHFTNLNELNASWVVSTANKTIKKGTLDLETEPNTATEFTIPLQDLDLSQDEDVWITFSFTTKEDQLWASKGHEVAWEQFLIQKGVEVLDAVTYKGDGIQLIENGELVIVKGKEFEYGFEAATGIWNSAVSKETELLNMGPQFNLWRAPLANDIDRWSSSAFESSRKIPGSGKNREGHWRTVGIDELKRKVDKFDVQQISDNLVRIVIQSTFSAADELCAFELHQCYDVKATGEIELKNRIISQGDVPDWLPKAGLQMNIPKDFDRVKWYGRGPFETYPDRKTGAQVGVYESSASGQYVPYLIPQDYGNNTDVRWLELSDTEGRGWRIKSEIPFNFSLHMFTPDNLERAMYPFQLSKADHLVLNLDHAVAGVGDTSKSTLQAYRVLPGVFEFSFLFKPLNALP